MATVMDFAGRQSSESLMVVGLLSDGIFYDNMKIDELCACCKSFRI